VKSPLVQSGGSQPSDKTAQETGTPVARKKIALSTNALKVRGSIAQLTASGGSSSEFDSYSEHRS
jgi:hypothetical protein